MMLNFYFVSNGQVNFKKAIQQCFIVVLGEVLFSIFWDKMLIVVYSIIGYDFDEIIVGVCEVCLQVEFVGCICVGVIGKEGVNESMCVLGVMVIVFGKVQEYYVMSCDNICGYNFYEEV